MLALDVCSCPPLPSGDMSVHWFESALLPQGWRKAVSLRIEGGLITEIRIGASPGDADGRYAVGVAGLSNLHSHAFQRAMAGLAETAGPGPDDFWTWRNVMYRFLDRVDPDAFEAIAEFSYMEMLESGFTRVGEFHYLHRDGNGDAYQDPAELCGRAAAAAASSGIGLTLLPVLYAHANFGAAPPTPGQRRFVMDIEGFNRLLESARNHLRGLDGAVLGVAPHSLRAVSAEQLKAAIALLPTGPIHIHAAEQMKEVEDCVSATGLRPVRWLVENCELDERWTIVHATHLDDGEIRELALSGAVAGLCPVTEANLGDGIFHTREYALHGGAYGIGTDSNIRIDAAEELRALEYAQRLRRRSRNVLALSPGASTGRTIFEAAAAGGARSLRGSTGCLRKGAPADLVALDALHPALLGRKDDALLDSWIFAAGREAIVAAWRHGRKVVSHGRHVNRPSIEARYRSVMSKLLG